MFKSIILSLLLLHGIADDVDEDNKPEIHRQTRGRIVGGELAPANKYPWFTRLMKRNGNWACCGGMLVTPEYVLTAAHCVVPESNWSTSNAAVEIGSLCPKLADNCGQPKQTINVASITTHPNYNSNTDDNDFALVKLVSKANAKPVKM